MGKVIGLAIVCLIALSACQTTGGSGDRIVLPASVIDTETNRRAAAERYLATFDLKQLYRRIGSTVVADMPERAKRILDILLEGTDTDRLDQAMIDTFVRVYTADELNALAAFYGTETGKSITGKQDKFLAQMMPVFIQAIMRSMLSAAPPATSAG